MWSIHYFPHNLKESHALVNFTIFFSLYYSSLFYYPGTGTLPLVCSAHLTTTYRYVRKVTFSFFGYGYTYVHHRSGNFSEMLLTVYILCHHWNTVYRNWNGTRIWHFFMCTVTGTVQVNNMTLFMWTLFSCQIFAISISVRYGTL